MNKENNPPKAWKAAVIEALFFGLVFGLTNIISFLYIVIAGHKLTPAEYGIFNALLGLISLGGVFANSIQIGTTQTVKSNADEITLENVLGSAWKYAFFGGALFVLVLLPFKQELQSTTSHIALGGLCLFTMIVSSAIVGYLVGKGKVRAQADLACYGAIARLSSGWIFLLAGFGISGALGGYVINYILVFLIAVLAGKNTASPTHTASRQYEKNIKIETPTLLIFILTYATFTLDQFVIQFFNPAIGGIYAAAATIAKLVFFAAIPIIAIAYSRILAQTDSLAQIKTVTVAAIAISICGSGLVFTLWIFPYEINSIFFGNQFEAAAADTAMLALGTLFFSMSVLAVHAKIALKNSVGYLPAITLLAAGFLLHANRHQVIEQIVENQVVIFGAQMLILWANVLYTFRKATFTRRQTIGQ